jgi:hypothetical protein
MEQIIPDLACRLDEMMAAVNVQMPKIAETGHNSSLSKSLFLYRRAEAYARFNWFIVTVPTKLILGDTLCVFETAGQRRFKPLDDKDEKIRRIYLPVSSHRVVVGTPHSTLPDISAQIVNKASARCSYEFFVSAVSFPANSSLVRGIGQWSGLMSQRELAQLTRELESDVDSLIETSA